MADCKLTIEIDDATTPRKGGEPVTGTILVKCDGPTKCSGLELTSYWTTHGRGNVNKGDIDSSDVFQGNWDANQEYRYKFSLKTANWPPTYYGTYLNVSHYVRARARTSWTGDPKADIEFPVIATSAPEDLKPTVTAQKSKYAFVGWIIAALLLLIFGALFLTLLLFLVPILLVGGAIYWFFRVFLPRQVTGSIECTIEPLRLTAGDTVRGRLRFTPKRTASINGIDLKVTCFEKCVSGSGSNRTTHRHEIFTTSQRLSEAQTLRMGQTQMFEFNYAVPDPAPPSLKFTDNELNWTGQVRIDIPKWPDWVHDFSLMVTPKESGAAAVIPNFGTFAGYGNSQVMPLNHLDRLPTSQEKAWFDEVVQQVLQSRDAPDRMQTVLDAIRDQVFVIRIELNHEVEEDPHEQVPNAEKWGRGTWMLGFYDDVDVDLYLLWPPPDELPTEGDYDWCGKVSILGYDKELDALMLRILARGEV